MAGFSNVLTGLSLVNTLVSGAASQGNTHRQQEADIARQQAEYDRALNDAAQKRAQLDTEAKSAEETRQAALKRAVARQRNLFGASGISPSSSGSAEAVLLGLFEESEQEKVERERLDTVKRQAIDNDLSYASRINVLERSAARDKQSVNQASSLFDTVGSAIRIIG